MDRLVKSVSGWVLLSVVRLRCLTLGRLLCCPKTSWQTLAPPEHIGDPIWHGDRARLGGQVRASTDDSENLRASAAGGPDGFAAGVPRRPLPALDGPAGAGRVFEAHEAAGPGVRGVGGVQQCALQVASRRSAECDDDYDNEGHGKGTAPDRMPMCMALLLRSCARASSTE